MTTQETSQVPAANAVCLLTLVLPHTVEAAVLELLESSAALESGYSVLPAQGLGIGAQLHTVMEQVQGRARRVLVQAVLQQDQLPALLESLRAAVPSAEVSYWVAPLLEHGRLA
jgi:hypothetical protein